MEIKKIKVVRKSNYNSDKYYIKFKRLFFGFIPMWFYLRASHLRSTYKLNKYYLYINIVLITLLILGIKYIDFVGANVLILSILFMYNIHYLVEHIGSYKINRNVYYGDNEEIIKNFVESKIEKFNLIHSKKHKRNEVVYSNDDNSDRYYQINIPKINFKKFIY